VILDQNSKMIEVYYGVSLMAYDNCQYMAATHGLKPRLSSMMIGFGIPISFYHFSIFTLYFDLFNFFFFFYPFLNTVSNT
jgi:hypothetical protein